VGVFGDDWARGEPLYDIGPSGTDEEHYEELAQYRVWLRARGLRALEAAGLTATPPGTDGAPVDHLLAGEFGPTLLDREDPAIRAAAALSNGLADSLFNTPNTRWVLGIGEDQLQQLGLDGPSTIEQLGGTDITRPAEPWLPDDVERVLATAASRAGIQVPQPESAEGLADPHLARLNDGQVKAILGSGQLAKLARSASSAALLAWVDHVRLPQLPWHGSERWEIYDAEASVDSLRGFADEERLILQGLERDLKQVGSQWWSPNRKRMGELQARIAERTQVVTRLEAELRQAADVFAAAARRQANAQEAWAASNRLVLDRGVAACYELQQREDGLLDQYVKDPPAQLLETLGPQPPDLAGEQAWRDQARQVERARATDLAPRPGVMLSITGRGDRREPQGPTESSELVQTLERSDLDSTVRDDNLEVDLEP
jgi:hypothetical protein